MTFSANTNCYIIIISYTKAKEMKYYSKIERATAERINEIEKSFMETRENWDVLSDELESLFFQIPTDYKNTFEEDGAIYIKFWDKLEFFDYIKIEKPKTDINWLLNAYPKCCYLLSIIQIERGEFEEAFHTLNKGLELESDNPLLLNEMGLLMSSYGQTTKDDKYFQQAIAFHQKAFESRPYNTISQKARSLRGIGFALMELNDIENAEKYYEVSLEWEESDNARSELEIIKELKTNPERIIYQGISNFNQTEQINSYEYFLEQKEKLQNTIKGKIPKKYVYIWTKASRYLSMGTENFRHEDYFNYPMEEWDLEQIRIGVIQIVKYLKGITPEHIISLNTIEDVEHLLLTFHFKLIDKKFLDINENDILLQAEFQHKMDNDKIVLFFQIAK